MSAVKKASEKKKGPYLKYDDKRDTYTIRVPFLRFISMSRGQVTMRLTHKQLNDLSYLVNDMGEGETEGDYHIVW